MLIICLNIQNLIHLNGMFKQQQELCNNEWPYWTEDLSYLVKTVLFGNQESTLCLNQCLVIFLLFWNEEYWRETLADGSNLGSKEGKKERGSVIGRTGLSCFSHLPHANPMLCYGSCRNCQCNVSQIAMGGILDNEGGIH